MISVMSKIFHSRIPDIIGVMYEHPGMSNRQIAYAIEMDESGLSKQLRLLELKGMTVRKDRRWYLTAIGTELAPEILALGDRIERTMSMEDVGGWKDFLIKYDWSAAKEDA